MLRELYTRITARDVRVVHTLAKSTFERSISPKHRAASQRGGHFQVDAKSKLTRVFHPSAVNIDARS